MNRITAEWTMAMSKDGRELPDNMTFAEDGSQVTLTVHVPTLAAGVNDPMIDVGSLGAKGGAPAVLGGQAFDAANVWNIHKFVGQCLGYTKHVSPQWLRRWNPARHPFAPHMRAVKITNAKGIGEQRKKVLSPLSRIDQRGRAIEILIPQLWELTILFQTLPYEVKEDSEITDIRQEGSRYVETYSHPSVEILNKPGGAFKFVQGSGAASGKDYPQPIGYIYGTSDIIMLWHQVPKSAIYDADGIASKILNLIGRVNDNAITGTFNVDVSVGDDLVGAGAQASGTTAFAPGNLLLTAAVIKPEQSPVPPQLMDLGILQTPRTFSVEYHLKHDKNGHNRKPYTDGTFYLCTHNGMFPPDGKTIFTPTDLSQMFVPLVKG